ncbi:TRAP transporter permease [Planosporangium sp. 12N6]|uniref:TRAP transporter permease n=1 Tax=Planosporangium spinosum TaxID=3402278 RepID=UPI003CF78F63
MDASDSSLAESEPGTGHLSLSLKDNEASVPVGTQDRALSPEAAAELAAQFEEEKPGRVLTGRIALLVSGAAVVIGLLVLWQLFAPLAQGSQYYLILFLAGVLPLVFLSYSSGLRAPKALRIPKALRHSAALRRPAPRTDRPTVADWVLAVVALVVCLYPVLPVVVGGAGGGYDDFLNRQGLLDPVDTAMGTVLLLLILEACRRTTGWVLPAVCVAFIGYAYYGGYLPQGWSIAHAGLNFDQIVDALYNSGSGFYGTPLDVAASYIVLFTIYGAVLDLSGAGAFFVDLSVAAFRRSRGAAGRTAVAAGFLLGTVSGSGAATTVSVGAVTWPILRRAGYPAERAGGMLAASGVGAILSPPTLGAAAFIIAEYLDVSYLRVLAWATVPTVLYYLGILLAVEIDARRFGVRPVTIEARSPWRLLARFGYHFSSLFVIVVFLAFGLSATRAVVYATLLAAVLSYLDRRFWLTPRRLFEAFAAGIRGVLPVAAVCAAAGIITAITTKTGLGPQTAALLVDGARAVSDNATVVALLTAVFAGIALTLLGLAIPVTASFIIGWVVVGPALINLDVSKPAAAMFVFYFAVLSEVTPPTALAAVAAAAVTGGRIIPTMWQTLRYSLPAYLVPLAFVLTPAGEGLLGRGGTGQIAFALAASALGVATLAIAAGGWLPGIGPAGTPARVLAAAAGLTLLWLEPIATAIGAVLAALAVVACLVRRRMAAPAVLGAAGASREEM